MKMYVVFFWVMMQYSPVGGYQHFRGTFLQKIGNNQLKYLAS
jgi:hypothetical protein